MIIIECVTYERYIISMIKDLIHFIIISQFYIFLYPELYHAGFAHSYDEGVKDEQIKDEWDSLLWPVCTKVLMQPTRWLPSRIEPQTSCTETCVSTQLTVADSYFISFIRNQNNFLNFRIR